MTTFENIANKQHSLLEAAGIQAISTYNWIYSELFTKYTELEASPSFQPEHVDSIAMRFNTDNVMRTI